MPTPDAFEVFGIEPKFQLNLTELEQRHRELSRALHPDRFSGSPARERRLALHRAIEVNQAWLQLRDPVQRAELLMSRCGIAAGEGVEPAASPTLLMKVMEYRERLGEAHRARDEQQVQWLVNQVQTEMQQAHEALSVALDAAKCSEAVVLLPLLGELRYYRRILDTARALADDLA